MKNTTSLRKILHAVGHHHILDHTSITGSCPMSTWLMIAVLQWNLPVFCMKQLLKLS